MIKSIIAILFYISIFFNSNLMCDENTKELKIGLLAPFSGIYKNLGDSLLLSTQLALNELNNKKIIIIPRDSGSNDKEKSIRYLSDQIIDSFEYVKIARNSP